MQQLHMISFALVIIGGLNWLLLGLFGWDIGQIFGGQGAIVSRIIYVLVGLAAVYELLIHKNLCKGCQQGAMPAKSSSASQSPGSM